MLHVAIQLHKALLLDDAYVGGYVAAYSVARRPPAEPPAVSPQMVERHPHLADVNDVEGQVVQVAVALVHERHYVVVAVYVEPYATFAEPVRDPHAEHTRVELHAVRDLARQEVHVPELAGMAHHLVFRRPRVRRPAHLRLPVGHDAHPVSFGICDLEPLLSLLVGHA